jgi:hypothetical protein
MHPLTCRIVHPPQKTLSRTPRRASRAKLSSCHQLPKLHDLSFRSRLSASSSPLSYTSSGYCLSVDECETFLICVPRSFKNRTRRHSFLFSFPFLSYCSVSYHGSLRYPQKKLLQALQIIHFFPLLCNAPVTSFPTVY